MAQGLVYLPAVSEIHTHLHTHTLTHIYGSTVRAWPTGFNLRLQHPWLQTIRILYHTHIHLYRWKYCVHESLLQWYLSLWLRSLSCADLTVAFKVSRSEVRWFPVGDGDVADYSSLCEMEKTGIYFVFFSKLSFTVAGFIIIILFLHFSILRMHFVPSGVVRYSNMWFKCDWKPVFRGI